MTLPSLLVSSLERHDLARLTAQDPELRLLLEGGGELPLLSGERTVLFRGSSYSRSQPKHIGSNIASFPNDLRAFFAACDATSRLLPDCVHVEIEEALLIGSVVHARIGDLWHAVYETVRHVDRPYVSTTLDAATAQVDHIFEEADCRYFYLGSAGSFNYGHWLVDDLPRVVWLIGRQEKVLLLLHSYGQAMDAVRRESIEVMLGRSAPLLFLSPEHTYEVKRLSYASPVTLHPVIKLPEAMDFVRRRIGEAMEAGHGARRRLLVTRASGRGRALTNADEVHAIFADAGFELVNPEGMSFAEQARTFGDAEAVVGLMGAAMTNTIFSPAGCKVGYLAPQGWQEPFYWDLANVMGHPYFTTFGPVASSDQPVHLTDFSIEPEDAAALLDAMEAG